MTTLILVTLAALPLYPATHADIPDLPSPTTLADGREIVTVRLHDGTFGLVDVTPTPEQLGVDVADFPTLAATGLHDPATLPHTQTITGRDVEEITALARPGALAEDGFLAADETILSVLAGDDALVRAMGLTHADLARPLLHVWNLIQTDLAVDRWNMAHHRWEIVTAVLYNGRWVRLDAHDTKGGQLSPFADGLEGGFWIVIRSPLTPEDQDWLHERYPHLGPDRWNALIGGLSRLFTGEMEPHYVSWYGFYEGHTGWRVDPVTIAAVFGLRSLAELDAAFPGRLDRVLTDHHTP